MSAVARLGRAIRYFTIVPLPQPPQADPAGPGPDEIAWLPLIGTFVGVIAGTVARGAARFLGPESATVVAFAGPILATGALHVDGFLDTCDAALASTPPERRREIARDPHHGTFAVAGAVLASAANLAALHECGPERWPVVLALAETSGRLAALLAARPASTATDGTAASAFARMPARGPLAAQAVALAAVAYGTGGRRYLAATVASGVAVFTCAAFIRNRFGGDLGGDGYGASIVLGSTIWLVLAAPPADEYHRYPHVRKGTTMAAGLDTERVSLYQPEQPGLIFPETPRFASLAQERDHRKRHLVAAVRAFALHGFDYGFAGHLTVRDPERPELYWTNPMCVHFSQVKLSNLVLADHAGNVVEGTHALNRAGFVLHSAVHEAHPEIVAMCHAHTTYGTAWCSTGRPLDMISQDAACFYKSHIVIAESAGAVAVEEGSGRSIAAAWGDNRAVLHRNHGLLTASKHSIDDAAFWFIALERCCRVQLAVEASGVKPHPLSDATAAYSREHVGSDYIGWLHFQTIYEQLAAQQPDMFD